jgi:hypothetical protein
MRFHCSILLPQCNKGSHTIIALTASLSLLKISHIPLFLQVIMYITPENRI